MTHFSRTILSRTIRPLALICAPFWAALCLVTGCADSDVAGNRIRGEAIEHDPPVRVEMVDSTASEVTVADLRLKLNANQRAIIRKAGGEIRYVSLFQSGVTDITPLAGMASLMRLNIAGSQVADLTPLAGLQLERLIFTPGRIERGLEVVRSMPTLQAIGTSFETVLPPEQFWPQFDAATEKPSED